MASNKNAAVGFIFITLLIDIIGFGIIIPVMPKLIAELKQVDISAASKYGGWLMFVYAFMQFLCAPLFGSLSDKYGRRKVLLFSLLGFGIDYLFLALAPTYAWLFIGRVISGITGASITTGFAYIADVSTAENRAKNFGLVGAAFGLGFIIGPLIGGLLGQLGPRVPFYAAAALALLNCLYGYFILPESLPADKRRNFEWKRANPLTSLTRLLKYPALTGLIIALVLVYLASHAVQSNWSYFTMFRFSWNEKMVGISLAVVGLLVAIVQGGLTRVVNPKLGNEKSIYFGLLFYTVGMFLFGIANQGWMMFVFLIPYCAGGIAQPSLQAVMAGQVPANEQGELQGSLTSLQSACAIIGPLLMNNLFFYFSHDNAPVFLPGAPFLLGALLLLIAFVVAYRSLHIKKRLG
ncbi:MAG: Tetracycline resistance protein class [Bacteroidota bacterium]|jgi:MFS transporter, DHA1 family, tetracycline resistance protein